MTVWVNICIMLCSYRNFKTTSIGGTQNHFEKCSRFVLSSHLKPIGNQNDVQDLSVFANIYIYIINILYICFCNMWMAASFTFVTHFISRLMRNGKTDLFAWTGRVGRVKSQWTNNSFSHVSLTRLKGFARRFPLREVIMLIATGGLVRIMLLTELVYTMFGTLCNLPYEYAYADLSVP